eukprot:CAMPEP_0183579640 /NCGR_PEP_ID=MMETSP0371-20130417/144225_1 /TAXON_ID=268820 /ORGANISM="Peridinium aciculiferum, Strain PAER-2" /LENGTH=95 /DNA_ID=CAMNT_0025790165 /DNA_START=6 /DNA_END=289 /DNA_ORIENTATION=-
MRREFFQHQSSADSAAAALEGDLKAARSACEALAPELEFWRGKAQQLMAARGLSQADAEVAAASAAAAAQTRSSSSGGRREEGRRRRGEAAGAAA